MIPRWAGWEARHDLLIARPNLSTSRSSAIRRKPDFLQGVCPARGGLRDVVGTAAQEQRRIFLSQTSKPDRDYFASSHFVGSGTARGLYRLRALRTASWCEWAHFTNGSISDTRDRPMGVSWYSTLGGTVGYAVRFTNPSSSSERSVCASTRFEMSPMARFNSVKRRAPGHKVMSVRKLHLSPIRSSTSRTGHNFAWSLPGGTGRSFSWIVDLLEGTSWIDLEGAAGDFTVTW
jgi:hypothetical protein